MKPIILLGAGFAAEAIWTRYNDEPVEIIGTSRFPRQSNWIKIRFDLADPDSWKNIPENCDIVWTFPAEPESRVKRFHSFLKVRQADIRIVLGTTSAYLSESGEITEESPVNETLERVKSERFLMDQGANWLLCSGLWGYGKHPFTWLANGLIKNRNKTVNLLHVGDLAEYISRLLVTGDRGLQINVSDGKIWWWHDLMSNARKSGIYFTPVPESGPEQFRLIRNEKLVRILGPHDFREPYLPEEEPDPAEGNPS